MPVIIGDLLIKEFQNYENLEQYLKQFEKNFKNEFKNSFITTWCTVVDKRKLRFFSLP